MIEDRLANGSRYEQARARLQLDELNRYGTIAGTYRYPIQVWQPGDQITWVAMGGEVVVDYSLRLKREQAERQQWLAKADRQPTT